MPETLLLVDFENVSKLDLSELDDSVRVLIFVGANQNPPKKLAKAASTKRFSRVDFQKIAGSGKNALDFHIAFHLGRVFETAPTTKCIVLAKDTGYDPLLLHLKESGMDCCRVSSLAELVQAGALEPTASEGHADPALFSNDAPDAEAILDPESTVCRRCSKADTVEHHGGRWCVNCGCFASAPDPKLLPSMQPGYLEPRSRQFGGPESRPRESEHGLKWTGCSDGRG